MSKVNEIQAALAGLTNQELRELEASLQAQYRARKMGILYHDAYGLWTEEDQASVGAEVFRLMDQREGPVEPS